jgi:hypothetical protein
MRSSVILLLLASIGVLLGGALIARWALGVCVIADSAAVAVFALLHDDGSTAQPSVHELRGTVAGVLERARRAG